MFASLLGGGAKKLVGIDFGASALKIVSLKQQGAKLLVDALAVVPLSEGVMDDRGIQDSNALLHALNQALDMNPELRKKSFALAIHGSGVFTKRIVLPKIPKKEIPEQVRWEAEQVFPQDLSTIIVDHVLLGETQNLPNSPKGTKGWELLLVGVHQDDVLNAKAVVDEQSLDLRLVDLDSFVIGDLLEKALKLSAKKHIALVDVGATATRVSVRHKGNTVFMREFPLGGNSFTESIAAQLGLSFADAESLKVQSQDEAFPQEAMEAIGAALEQWKLELQQTEDIFVSQESDATIAEWHFFGGGSLTPSLQDVLGSDERFQGRAKLVEAHKLLKVANKKVDKDLLNQWACRLLTASGLSCRSA